LSRCTNETFCLELLVEGGKLHPVRSLTPDEVAANFSDEWHSPVVVLFALGARENIGSQAASQLDFAARGPSQQLILPKPDLLLPAGAVGSSRTSHRIRFGLHAVARLDQHHEVASRAQRPEERLDAAIA